MGLSNKAKLCRVIPGFEEAFLERTAFDNYLRKDNQNAVDDYLLYSMGGKSTQFSYKKPEGPCIKGFHQIHGFCGMS